MQTKAEQHGGSQFDPKATLRGRARSELAAVLGAVTAVLSHQRDQLGLFSDVHCDAVYLGKARAFTDVYPSRARGTQASGTPLGSLPGYCSRFPSVQ
jgi:hypothetical protein